MILAQWDTTSASESATLAYQTVLHTQRLIHQHRAPLVLLDLLLLAAFALHVLLIVILALLEQGNAILLDAALAMHSLLAPVLLVLLTATSVPQLKQQVQQENVILLVAPLGT